ncbi:hypothetical protein G6F56_000532 [Rhizopus delemar]|uniref:O-fucosyltransferase family protein n=1 Tax=Rhizopus stolonifer TaxID=4846 RepID=A0A367KXD5_RHIST|nr:hypothetical protein G6F56_000532 [Rhizopus delemar]RCI06760.1 hypothetical protein CU098_008553 [Rhizopus stolonifer]
MFLVTYTTTQSISVQLRFKMKPFSAKNGGEDGERYITYYPHSGLHNQRLAIINAIVLAKALNRTLILPEINIGKGTSWAPTSRYERKMSLCPLYHRASDDCSDFRKYVPLPAETIFDLSAARAKGVRIVYRTSMSETYFQDEWSASEQDIYRIQDKIRLSYRVYDLKSNDDNLRNFTQRIDIEDLATRQERFMVFGSLHYTNRLALSDPQLTWFINYLREEISLGHPVVIKQALRVVSRLGGPDNFVGVHLRQGDGFFKKSMMETVDAVRLALEQDSLSFTQTGQLTVPGTQSLTFLESETVQRLQEISDIDQLLDQCLLVQSKDGHPRLRLIYMATDTPQPRITLTDLHKEFPCVFTLSDFPGVIQDIVSANPMGTGNEIVDAEYERVGSTLNGLLIPMVDAEITSHGSAFIGTKKSTFSSYIKHRFNRFQTIYTTLTSN